MCVCALKGFKVIDKHQVKSKNKNHCFVITIRLMSDPFHYRKRPDCPQQYGENPTSPTTMNVEVDPVILNRSPEPVQNSWEDDLSIKNGRRDLFV